MIHIKTVAGIQWRAGLFKEEDWQPDVFGGSFYFENFMEALKQKIPCPAAINCYCTRIRVQ